MIYLTGDDFTGVVLTAMGFVRGIKDSLASIIASRGFKIYEIDEAFEPHTAADLATAETGTPPKTAYDAAVTAQDAAKLVLDTGLLTEIFLMQVYLLMLIY